MYIRNIVGAGNVLGFMALGIVFTLGTSILADLTDEHERVHHVRQEGLYYGAMSLFQKFSSGFGNLFAGLIADFSGISNLKGAEMATPEKLSRFGWTIAPVLILVTVIAVSFLRHYDIDKARLKEILAKLASRKTADAEVVSGMNFGNATDRSGKR